MANIFTITTPQQTLKANANGEATTVFTVTNATPRPMRGFVKIKPLDKTQAQWLKIDGETERDFPAGGTHQFTVDFAKPKPSPPPTTTQPAESFPFRLDAISAINPDEDFTEGPTVTVEVPEQKVEPPKKPFPWLWIIIGAVVLLIIIGVVIWLLSRGGKPTPPTPTPTPTATVEMVEVPDVERRLLDDAESRLKGFNVVKVFVGNSGLKPDQVISQDPKPGTKIPAGATVTLRVAEQPVPVPNFVGMTFGQALDALKKANLELGNLSGDREAVHNGALVKIKAQAPAKDEIVSKGTKIDLIFPCGANEPCPVTVFEHDGFQGRSQSYNEGTYTNSPGNELDIVGNDIISSLRVKEGYIAKLCPAEREDNSCREFTAGEWNSLSKFNMNDVTSYIRVWKVK